MANYTLPVDTNVTGMHSLGQYINDVSGGWFFIMAFFGIFIVSFISLKAKFTSSRAFGASAFLNMTLMIIARALQLVSNKWMYLSIILVGISMVWMHFENASGS